MSPSPTNLSMETAMGVTVAQTTALGMMEDSAAESSIQKTSCLRKEPPTRPRNLAAMRLSSPVSSHDTVRMEAPSSSKMVSEA